MPSSSLEESIIWPVEFDQEDISFTDPGSVQSIFSMSPMDNVSMAFLVFNIGRGQESPLQSNSCCDFRFIFILPHGVEFAINVLIKNR